MRRAIVALLAAAAATGTARADVISGEVIAAHGAWEGGAIVTTATVRTAAGDVEVRQLGGSADGYGMVVFDGELPLEPGRRVVVTARRDGGAWMADEVRAMGSAGRVPYVRTTTSHSGKPLSWAHSCVQIGYAVEGTTAIAGDDERPIIEQTFATWNDGVASCSFQHLASLGPIAREVSGRDFVTVIKFRDTEWCRPPVDGKPKACHSPTAAGVTTAVYVNDPDDDRDGEIVDADVELNGVNFAISVGGVSLGTASCKSDLANTLTHELGHVLGLEHTCRSITDDPRVDNLGRPVPLCDDTSDPLIEDATMYPTQRCGETTKASLSPDDVQSMCDVYPIADGPGTCAGPDSLDAGCCSSAGAPAGSSLGLGLVILALLRRRRDAR